MEWKKPILKKINKYYGASFECSDFESLYKLVDEALTSAYERGRSDERQEDGGRGHYNRKINELLVEEK